MSLKFQTHLPFLQNINKKDVQSNLKGNLYVTYQSIKDSLIFSINE